MIAYSFSDTSSHNTGDKSFMQSDKKHWTIKVLNKHTIDRIILKVYLEFDGWLST